MWQKDHTEQLIYGFDESEYIDYNESIKNGDETVKSQMPLPNTYLHCFLLPESELEGM